MKTSFRLLSVLLLGLVCLMAMTVAAQESTPEATPEATPEVTPEATGTPIVITCETLAFWRLHPNEWPLSSVTLGNQQYSQAESVALMNTQVQGDASLPLAQQLIGAQLNIAVGCVTVEIQQIVIEANNLLILFPGRLPLGVDVTSPEGQSMTTLIVVLGNFNNGGDDDDDNNGMPVTIVIEGPVEAININIIVIYGIEVEIDPLDPILTVIRIGDLLRVEGNYDEDDDDDNHIVLIAVTIIIVNIDIYINIDGTVYREEFNCGNPPPPWAPAWGWRRRCENNGGDININIITNGNGNGNGGGNGMGMGMGDDD